MFGSHRSRPRVEVVGIVDEADLHPELRERVVELVVGAAVERRRRDDVPAVLGQVRERHELGGLPARGGQRAHAALERGHAVLEHRLGGVHDPRVDVAELLEPEQRRRVRGVAEHVAGGLVDGNGAGAGGRIGRGARVDLLGLETPALGHGDDSCRRRRGPTLRRQTRPINQDFARGGSCPTEYGADPWVDWRAWRRSRNSSPTATSSGSGWVRAGWATCTVPATSCSSGWSRSRCRRRPSPRPRRNGSSAKLGPRRA